MRGKGIRSRGYNSCGDFMNADEILYRADLTVSGLLSQLYEIADSMSEYDEARKRLIDTLNRYLLEPSSFAE